MRFHLLIYSLLSVLCWSQELPSIENYIYTKTCLSADCVRKLERVEYFDGLGRAKQVVDVRATPKSKDIVTHIEYDGFGRQTRNYLPIPQSGTQNGNIYPSPLANASAIYGNEKIYSEKELENSPLDRLLSQTQVGNDWQNKPIRFSYEANTTGDTVKKFITMTSWEDGATKTTLSQSGEYGETQLYKTTTTDEDGNPTIEFKNGLGQVLLIRKKLNDKNVDTYYVYNEYNHLAFVIPPLAVEQMSSNIAQTLDLLCYQYRYDGRGRMVEKKLPNKGWEYLVYDQQDRLVLTQDANLRTNKNTFHSQGWLFTKYDHFGRVIYTGFFQNSSTRHQMQTALSNIRNANNEERSTTPFNFNGLNIYYTKNAFPSSSIIPLSVNYYDTYPDESPEVPASILGQETLKPNVVNHRSTKGLALASMVKNIEDNLWTKTYTYYDTKARVIGSFVQNHLGGYTRVESELDFSGIMQTTLTYHKRKSDDTEIIITERFLYDHQNRLIKHFHKVDNQPEELLTYNEYDELSRLKTKKVGGVEDNPLQSVDYQYNIRGWLTGINTDTEGNFQNGKLFNFKVNYNRLDAIGIPSIARYNGYISQTSWRTSLDNIRRNYAYQYDTLDRLLKGSYIATGTPSSAEKDFYNEALSYDLNGNITTLTRFSKPPRGTTPMKIDDLQYHYIGNQLKYITDQSQNTDGYPIGGKTIYYDDNGNMTSHKGKAIDKIIYNYLNLPSTIITGAITTKYTYRSDGVKIKKEIAKSFYDEPSPYTEYLEGFQYQIQKRLNKLGLSFVPTAEGYYDYIKRRYVYNYTDHLGNIRVSYYNGNRGLVIDKEKNYYPFGLEHKGYNNRNGNSQYNYQYNGKELQTETGMYDYGARLYMPEVGIFGQHDPLSEKTLQPFAYAYNNPIKFIDPTGMMPEYCPNCPNPLYEGQTMMGADGKLYGATTTNEGTTRLEWLRQVDMDEITIQGKAKGMYGSFDTSYDTGYSKGYSAMSIGYNTDLKYAGFESNLKMFSAYYTNNTGSGILPLALDIRGGASVMSAVISARLGTFKNGIFANANGDMWSANANLSAGIFTGEGQKYGVLADGNVGVQALKGEVNVGGSLFGISMQGTLGGTFGSAHIGGTLGIYFDRKTGSVNIKAQENIGLGIGEKAAIRIQIPVPFLRK